MFLIVCDDDLWWLMISNEINVVCFVLEFVGDLVWKDEMLCVIVGLFVL